MVAGRDRGAGELKGYRLVNQLVEKLTRTGITMRASAPPTVSFPIGRQFRSRLSRGVTLVGPAPKGGRPKHFSSRGDRPRLNRERRGDPKGATLHASRRGDPLYAVWARPPPVIPSRSVRG